MPLRARLGDIVLAVFVVLIVAMLVVPLPAFLLDILLVLNVSFGALLLIVALYIPNALSLLAFPTLLLLTTLYRLGLNVASTRLILSEGYAGEVIQSFGTFLIRGEVVLGVIIFLIVTLVNFIVVARGAARVSEVAARFALDAMPGKQMAIDSDLRAGLIAPPEAQRRREELRKESQLYGAMDGAMKFVQGDAIAGLVIIAVNIIGGVYFGLVRGMGLLDAVNTYTVLTVGDGLVNQIPAILISICAGIVVTRVSSGENTTLGTDVGSQLFERPAAVIFSGALLFFIAVLPGLPAIPFILVGALLVISGVVLSRRRTQSVRSEQVLIGLPAVTREGSDPQPALLEAPESDQLVMFLDSRVLYPMYRAEEQRYRNWWRVFSADFTHDVGLQLPRMRAVADDDLPAGHFRIEHLGSEIDRGIVPVGASFVEVHPQNAPALGASVVKEEAHPHFGAVCHWALSSSAMQRVCDAAGIRSFDPIQFLGLRVGAIFCNFPEEVMTLRDFHARIAEIEQRSPGFVQEAFQRRTIHYSRMNEALQELVREGVSVRDFQQLLEAMAACICAFPPGEEGECSADELVRVVRLARKRQIVSRALSRRGTLRVVTLSPEVQDVFESASGEPTGGMSLALEPDIYEQLQRRFRALWAPLLAHGTLPAVVLCASEARSRVVQFLRGCDRTVRVISYPELSPEVRLEPVGVWEI